MMPSCIARSMVIGWHGTSLSRDALRHCALYGDCAIILTSQGDCQTRDALHATEKKVSLILELDREIQDGLKYVQYGPSEFQNGLVHDCPKEVNDS